MRAPLIWQIIPGRSGRCDWWGGTPYSWNMHEEPCDMLKWKIRNRIPAYIKTMAVLGNTVKQSKWCLLNTSMMYVWNKRCCWLKLWQPMSAVSITAYEVQVSAADSKTVPTVATGVSKPMFCWLTLTFTLTRGNLSLYTTLLLLLVLIQLCSPRCWHLDANYCRTRCRPSQPRFVL